MRIALPIADGKFSLHYGSAQAISIHDIDLDKGVATDLGPKSFPDDGVCGAAQWVASQGVEVILAGGIGGGAAQGLGEVGIKVFAGVQDEDPAKVLELFLSGLAQAKELAPGESMCKGHGDEDEGEDHHGEGHVCHCKG
jgi:predicted Fe-Mo cluster-binding NifX family protein